jgi:hypothetical protein
MLARRGLRAGVRAWVTVRPAQAYTHADSSNSPGTAVLPFQDNVLRRPQVSVVNSQHFFLGFRSICLEIEFLCHISCTMHLRFLHAIVWVKLFFAITVAESTRKSCIVRFRECILAI